MSLILHIDTALQNAYVGISMSEHLLLGLENKQQNSHAAFVQPAIQQILKQLQLHLTDIEAVGVTNGPGSYTGLRVGMASAKGICYALQKPLVAASTLEVLTLAAIEKFPGFDLYCPMIDARRQEVYTALYNQYMITTHEPCAIILDEQTFAQHLSTSRILFFGDGALKLWNILPANGNAYMENVAYNNHHLSQLMFKRFKSRQFLNLAYAEPFYIKDFYFGKS
ncbi:MAG: tRNA (adenosine(37)-N6)-threonylcarbamoyltransferase complex dimerization subunit type 1 TsaB [Agriterribacter sp.]